MKFEWHRGFWVILFAVIIILAGVSKATTITRLNDLGEWYLHTENDTTLSQYRQWSITPPNNQTNITLEINKSGEYQIGQWISPYILSTSTTIQFEKLHNWMSKIWAKGENATLFFKLYTYSNEKEELIFTSCQSYELGNATDFKRQQWQCRDDNPHTINTNERLVVKLFINASVANKYTIGIDGTKTPSSITDPTEDRYFDWNNWTVNGLAAHKHITTKDSSLQYTKLISNAGIRVMYSAMRAWVLHSDGSTTEIGTAGTYKAVMSDTPTINKRMISATWTYPTTAVVATDAIKVNVYNRLIDSSFSESDLGQTFVTEQLGASSLDTNTVGLYQNIAYTSPNYAHLFWYGWYYFYGEYFENGGVTGWKWTPAPPAYSPNPSLDIGDPFYCSIPPFIPSAQSIPIFCMPKNNQTGQPLTGLTVTCKAWTSPIFGAQAQAASSATELPNGKYNWTFQIGNQAANTCYIINCSTTISAITNEFAGIVCVSQSFTTSCASTAEVNAVGANVTAFNQSTNNTLNNLANNVTQLTIMQQSANNNLTNFNSSTNGTLNALANNMSIFNTSTNATLSALDINGIAVNLTNMNDTIIAIRANISSLANISASDVWDYALREANCSNCTSGGGGATAQQVWEYSNRTLTDYNSTNGTINNTISYNYPFNLNRAQLRNISNFVWDNAPPDINQYDTLFIGVCLVVGLLIGIIISEYYRRRRRY